MTGSSSARAACLLLAWGALGLATFVGAPLGAGAAEVQGQTNGQAAAVAGTAPNNPPPSPPPDPHAVAVDALEAPHPDSMGLVSVAGGGFSDGLWRGTPAVTAQTLVSALPHRYAVPAARHLAIKFLLSAAPAEGAANANAMLEARILALAAMADWDDALALIDFIPAESRSPVLARTRIAGLLAKGRVDAACGEGTRFQEQADAGWAKLQVLCQFASGQNGAVAVSLGLLREQGSDDKIFFWATDIAQGNDVPPPAELTRAAANGALDPVVLALLRRAGYLLPKEVIEVGDPTVLLFAAQIAMAPPPQAPLPDPATVKSTKGKGKKAEKAVRPADTSELRLFTIERAAAAGVIDAEALRVAYATTDLSDDGATASPDSISIDTARQRAATYQLAIAQSAVGSRAEVVARVLDLTRLKAGGTLPDPVLTALVYAPVVMALPRAPDLAWFAGTAVRVLAAADSAAPAPVADSTAAPWLELMQAQALASTSHETAANFASVWPYGRLTRPGGAPITADEFAAWQATLPPDPARALALRIVALDLLTAVGDGVPAVDWQAAIAAQPWSDGIVTAPAPSSLLWNAIAQAERSGRVGEVTALALRFLGADAGAPASLAATKALESLAIVGRGADARAIAVELALDRGL